MLLSAGEIAASLLAGDVHLGITGEDLLREAAPELKGRIHLVKPLGFGFADVVVAVPQYWIDVSTMADLDDVCAAFAQRHRRRLRVATKYAQLTRSFFAACGHQPITASWKAPAPPKARRPRAPPKPSSTSPPPARRLARQRPEDSGRRHDPEKPGAARRLADRRLGRRGARRPAKICWRASMHAPGPRPRRSCACA